jgi:hypothetical protein
MDAEARPLVFTAQSKRFFYCREAVCEFAFAHGVIPINPFMAFGFFLGERTDRDAIRRANHALVQRCDELWVFGRDLADGVLKEITLAAKAEKRIRFFSIDDRPERIEELHIESLRFEDEVRNKAGRPRERLLADLRALLPATAPRDERSLALDL